MHCGDISTASSIYEGILRERATKNQTLLSRIWLEKIKGFKGKKDEALEGIRSIINEDNPPVQNAYLNMVLGEMLVEKGDEDEGLKCIKAANKTFEMAGLDVLEALGRVHLGVFFFRKGRFDESEFHFDKGYRAARRCGSEYLRSYIDANMADLHLQKKEMEAAEKRLKRAERIFKEYNDLYGLAGVHFNWALYHLAERDEVKAQDHMTKALNIAFPLPGTYLRDEWKRVYEERREKDRSEKGPKAL